MAKATRSWLELFAVCTAVPCALAITLAMITLAVALAVAQAPTHLSNHSLGGNNTFLGMVTDSECGARHKAESGKTAAQCAQACLRNGASFLLVSRDRNYLLDGDAGRLTRLLGRRAKVAGKLDGSVIRVVSVEPAL